jgi:hydroxymethylglutaryl-CoA reductase (NADPH)
MSELHRRNEEIETNRKFFQISERIPFNFPYEERELKGTCENVIGYIPCPLGVAGPLPVDGIAYSIPLATTEGALVASINRGCKLIRANNGINTILTDDGMTRGPVVRFPDIKRAHSFSEWINSETGFSVLKEAFDATSQHARLTSVKTRQAGRHLYIRLQATTGKAMGMNMIGKGTEAAISTALQSFPTGELLSLSGNYCVDKKASALNWIEGRGKSVVVEAFLSPNTITEILHCTPNRLIDVHRSKCMVGSALSGSIGGNNAHAANIVAAIFLATGQDIAQVVDSSFCLTYLETLENGQIHATVSMPCIQIGCIGGGTRLPPQHAAHEMIAGVDGDASIAARVVGAAVLAGELSLLGSLAEGSLMQAHLALNRPN